MAGEITTPMLPCAQIEEIMRFYEALGFRTTYRQKRPTGYAVMIREDLALHFFSMDGFVPADSYSSCLVGVPDANALYLAFREGLRSLYGKVPTSSIPRLTRPRKLRQNVTGFALIDPGGNWIRVHELARPDGAASEAAPRDTGRSALAAALHGAALLGDSKGDFQAAAQLLDKALAGAGTASDADRIAALAYRAELAISLNDPSGAQRFLAQLGTIPLDEATRDAVQDDIARADDLRQSLATEQ